MNSKGIVGIIAALLFSAWMGAVSMDPENTHRLLSTALAIIFFGVFILLCFSYFK